MADKVDPIIAAADAAAEALAKSQTESHSADSDPAREADLDAAFAEASKLTPPEGAEFGKENAGVQTAIEGAPKPGEEPKPDADEAAAAAAAAEAAAAKTAPRKGLLEDLEADPKPVPAVEDPYGQVKLRSDASPKTRETFEQLKTVAKQREDAAALRATEAETKLTELQTKVADLEKRTVPDDVQNELKELRSFRAQFDTANDPEFRQKFDSRTNGNYESIYNKLTAHQLPAEELAKLKAFSPEQRDTAIEKFLSLLPTGDRKFIEAKLLDNINVADERDRALQEARVKADEILAKRKGEPAQQVAQRDSAIAAKLKPVLQTLPWLHAKDIPANTAPEDKKRLEAHNEAANFYVSQLRKAIVDDSPEVRAEAALAVPLAHYFRTNFQAEKARADALQAKLDGITRASTTSRTARTDAGARGAQPPPAAVHQNTEDALDALFEEAQRKQ